MKNKYCKFLNWNSTELTEMNELDWNCNDDDDNKTNGLTIHTFDSKINEWMHE